MEFWKSRRVLVTGAGGFLGRSLVRELEARGPGALLTPRSARLDLRERDGVRAYLARAKPD
ncbi:MAG TPA: NAD-dependent epimerase/dehydratase family protein, partial [Thermoanaerobaculia bacterium]|nr:NAD-dependent epimerase/dehydratase family protein [Thermoanaerobaculia bacterium]